MNYLQQILAFNDSLMYKLRLSSGEIALWYALMSVNNKAGWIEWFTVANRTLESLSGLSRSGINKARNALKQDGLIDFKSNGRKATSYKVCVLYTSNSVQRSTQQGAQRSVQDSTQDGVQNSSTLVKHKHKQNINSNSSPIPPDTKSINNAPTREGIFGAIEKEFGRPLSPIELGQISSWLDQDSYKPEMISLALREAVLNQAYSLKYMDKILMNWERQHITTTIEYQAMKDKRNMQASDHQQRTKSVGPSIPLFKITDQEA